MIEELFVVVVVCLLEDFPSQNINDEHDFYSSF